MNAAQKRMRLMARQFAETGIRDLFLGVHDLLRSNATMADTIRLRNEWVQIEPSSWSRRKDVTIDIGIGSGGREEKLMKFSAFSDRISQIVEVQGGLAGPIVTAENIYALAEAFGGALDIKGVERFVTDPKQAPPQEEGPDPEAMKAQAEMQMMQAKLQMQQQEAQQRMQLDQQRAEFDAQMQGAKVQADQQAQREKAQLEAQLAREKAQFEAQMARERMEFEAQLSVERMQIEAKLKADANVMNASVKMSEQTLPANRPGGDLDK
jgi:hypothetical protein